MAGVLSGYMLVFAMVQSGHLGFGMHAINVQTPRECQNVGDKIVKQAGAENGSVFYTCYDVQNMVPLAARISASLEDGEVRFNSAARVYDTNRECVSAGNKFLNEADENFNYACYELNVSGWPAFFEGYRPK